MDSLLAFLFACFIAVCSAATTMDIIQSTYMGGTQSFGTATAVDSSGNLYVTGSVYGQQFDTFPTIPNVNKYNCVNDSTTMYVAKFSGPTLSWYSCVSAGAQVNPHEIFVDGSTLYVSGIADKGLPGAKNTVTGDNWASTFISKLSTSTGAITWSYYINANPNDYIVGMAPGPNGGVWGVGSTTAAFLNTSEGSGNSIPCSPDGDSEIFLLGLSADGSFQSAHCYGGAKDEHVYESYYDSKFKKLYTPGTAASGEVAGVDITPYIGPSGNAFFLLSLNIETGTFTFEGAEVNPLSTRKGSFVYGTVTETTMDPSGILHFIGDLSHANKTSILISFNPATKEFESTLYNNTMISAIEFDADSNMYLGGHKYGSQIPYINAFLTEGTHFVQVYDKSGELTFSSHLMRGPFKEFTADSLSIKVFNYNGEKHVALFSNMNWNTDSLPQVGPNAIATERGNSFQGFLVQLSVSSSPTVAPSSTTSEPTSDGAKVVVGFAFLTLALVTLLQ